MKQLLLAIFCLLLLHTAHAQVAEPPRTLPDWVYMIDNPSVNYYEALQSFDQFWKDRVKPVEEMEEGEEAEQEKEELESYLNSLSVSERNYWDQLQYHYKRFQRWKQDVLPFVQPGGTILTDEQKAVLWYQQQEEIKHLKK